MAVNKEDIELMGKLYEQISTLTAKLDALKDKVREDANGVAVSYPGKAFTISVTAPGKPTTTLDTTKWRSCAPKDYERVFNLYHKMGSPRKAAVNIIKNG